MLGTYRFFFFFFSRHFFLFLFFSFSLILLLIIESLIEPNQKPLQKPLQKPILQEPEKKERIIPPLQRKQLDLVPLQPGSLVYISQLTLSLISQADPAKMTRKLMSVFWSREEMGTLCATGKSPTGKKMARTEILEAIRGSILFLSFFFLLFF